MTRPRNGKALALSLVLLSFPFAEIQAEGGITRSLRVGSTLVPLIRWNPPSLTLSVETSPGCTETKPCDALLGLLQLQKKSTLPRSVSVAGGKNPGSVLCRKILKGEVILGQDLEGNTDSLCRFKDGSFTACSSLSAVMVKYW